MLSKLEAVDASNSMAYMLLTLSLLATFINYIFSGSMIFNALAMIGVLISAFNIGLTYSITRSWSSNSYLMINKVIIREGRKVDASLRIESPLFHLIQTVSINAITDDGLSIKFSTLRESGNSLTASGQLKGYVGEHELSHVVLRTLLIGGLSSISWRLRLHKSIKISPSLRYYRGLPAYVRRQAITGYVRSSSPGRGTEFLWIREYRPGDELRRVDWKSTARMQKPVIKVFESESLEKVFVFAALPDNFFTGERPAFPYVAEELFKLMTSLIGIGYKVLGLIATEDTYYIRGPLTGSEGLGSLASMISQIRWPTRPAIYSSVTRVLPWLIGELTPMFRGGCNALVIASPQSLNDVAALERVNSMLKAFMNHYVIYLTSPGLIRLSRGEMVSGDLINVKNELFLFKDVVKEISRARVLKFFKGENLLADLLSASLT